VDYKEKAGIKAKGNPKTAEDDAAVIKDVVVADEEQVEKGGKEDNQLKDPPEASDSDSGDSGDDDNKNGEDGKNKKHKKPKKNPPKGAGRPAAGLFDVSGLDDGSYLPQLVEYKDEVTEKVRVMLGVHPECMVKKSVHEMHLVCLVCGKDGAFTSHSKHKCPKWKPVQCKVTMKPLARSVTKKSQGKGGKK
jgi:hypothetical protein